MANSAGVRNVWGGGCLISAIALSAATMPLQDHGKERIHRDRINAKIVNARCQRCCTHARNTQKSAKWPQQACTPPRATTAVGRPTRTDHEWELCACICCSQSRCGPVQPTVLVAQSSRLPG
ncbi:uncharacterized protein AKAW2_30026S [Aspergillus luchuensis]|uniref:Serine protein kinase n=1 Tax=Aspergillus kawachii TaxID=1069201 RepID=A0A146F741_ASPKA|nr:uncharacterized protein AKAW2_30026S [Aspergillus luchuensis]BCR96707.1 hypothetical protein AKAW2_30026S [Aspergillus luchuensis]GAT21887.1 serine protein kinase [Aspergillus luchuensis]